LYFNELPSFCLSHVVLECLTVKHYINNVELKRCYIVDNIKLFKFDSDSPNSKQKYHINATIVKGKIALIQGGKRERGERKEAWKERPRKAIKRNYW